jgi:hypothetical protein
MPSKKELHYFNKNYHRKLRYYSSFFLEANNKVKGEITPAYSILPVNRIRSIRAIMPEVRLIFLMRDPIERAWSHAVMDLVQRPNFKKALHPGLFLSIVTHSGWMK